MRHPLKSPNRCRLRLLLLCGYRLSAFTSCQAASPCSCHAPLLPPCRCSRPAWGVGGWFCRYPQRLHPSRWRVQSRHSYRLHECRPCSRQRWCESDELRLGCEHEDTTRIHFGGSTGILLPRPKLIEDYKVSPAQLIVRATLNKPSIFLSQTCVTLIFEFCGPMRSPFGPFAGP